MAEKIKKPKNRTEGGKTFKRLRDLLEPLYYLVYDSELNMVTESTKKNPLKKGNVVDSMHESFGAETYAEMIVEAKKLGIKR